MIPHGPKDTFNHLTGRKGFDYNQITDEIFIGTNMCCQFGFSKELLLKGVRADISLEQDRTDAPDGVDYFLWLPTENGKAPNPKNLEIGVKFLDFLINNKIKTFIHCKNGHGRAPTLFAAYLISRSMNVQDAVKLITSKRPTIHLTDLQMQALNEYKTGVTN
ncbi:MAG: dual specificity protein phosphatase family protein [Candidatus Harrisonbacteria bacterium]|nr:dual specificity protein phosphatase family protein [Candidatus Harrisonbacteria bacterium]